jgi:hypothetical protein
MGCRYTYKGKTYEAHEFDDVLRAMHPAEATKFMPGVNSIPSAPFVTKTEAWTALALKRMIRYAAENGFDRVAWTNGEQQAARYDLSQHIESLQVKENTNGTFTLAAHTHDGQVKQMISVSRDDLADHVGKEMAEKIVRDEESRSDRVPTFDKKYENLDLKVGGEGMRSFYDSIVPNVANDVLKKLGGGRVGETGIKTGNAPDDVVDKWRGKNDEFVKANSPQPQQGFDITPELKKQALSGMPLFSKKADPFGDAESLRKQVLDAEDAVGAETKDLNALIKYGKRRADQKEVAQRVGEQERVIAGTQKRLTDLRRELATAESKRDSTPPLNDPTRQQSLFSRAPVAGAPDVKFDNIADHVKELFDSVAHSDKSLNFWERTVGTPRGKAEAVNADGSPKNPGFKRVYEGVQNFIRDKEMIAMDAMDKAPDLTPRLANMRDAFKRGPVKDDLRAASKAIFDGTLIDKRVYSDEELKSKGLSDGAIDLYRQARAGFDQSIDDHTASIAALLARDSGIPDSAAQEARADPGRGKEIYKEAFKKPMDEAWRRVEAARAQTDKELADYDTESAKRLAGLNPVERARESKDIARRREGIEQMATADIQQKITNHADISEAFDAIRKQFVRAEKLKKEGYAPLMRFGEHTVYAFNPETHEQISFSGHESQIEANREAARIAKERPDAQIVQGIRSHDESQTFEGVTPEAIKIFAKSLAEAGHGDEDAIHRALYQDYLKNVVNERSPLKRMIYRKGVPGYSEDLHRVLSSFIGSNASAASRNYHALEMKEGLLNIPKENGDVLKDASKLVDYVMNPKPEAAAIRGLLFTNFIGGSVASAVNNLTQVPLLTLPHLSRFGSVGRASKAIAYGTGVALGKVSDAPLASALARAKREGLLGGLEMHQLSAERTGRTASSMAYRRFVHVWGGLFQAAEQFNRRTTFAAAWDMAKDMSPGEIQKSGAKDAYDFAKRALDETQFVYNRGNRPNWGRGPVGATLMTFKSFTVNYIEFLNRLPAKQKALGLALLVAGAGVKGMPFAQDIEDVIDAAGQSLGWNTNSDEWMTRKAADILGKTGGDLFNRGASAIPGAPNFSNRIGLGHVVPGLAALKPSTKDRVSAALDTLGPAGSMVTQQALPAIASAQAGKPGDAAMALAPNAVRNVAKGAGMAAKGYAVDARGKKTVETSDADAIMQALGVQPYGVAADSLRAHQVSQDIGMAKSVQSDITQKVAQARVDQDAAAEKSAYDELRAWNEKNPDSRIAVSGAAVQSLVRSMRLERDARIVKGAPKGMRSGVQGGLQ